MNEEQCKKRKKERGETMEIEWTILNKILEMREKTRCTKFVGALTIELLRKELAKLEFNVSNRDVFIEGVTNELDLLIAKAGRQPKENLVYCPEDVLAVLEIKFRGSYGKTSVNKIREVFDFIKRLNKNIQCCYISVSENKNYKYRITKENLGYNCFELLTRDSSLESALERNGMRVTGDWDRLLNKLRLKDQEEFFKENLRSKRCAKSRNLRIRLEDS